MSRLPRTIGIPVLAAALLLAAAGCRTGGETPGPAAPPALPAPPPPKPSPFRILLDPGHGGEDPGAARNLLPEKHLNLLLAREIRRELVRRGFEVRMTRDGDFTLSLRQRQILADALQPDLLISVHHNAAHSTAAHGVECYFRTPSDREARKFWGRSRPAAVMIQRGIVARLPGVADRGVMHARFAVLIPKRPAVLIEAGFVSNPREELALHTAERRRRIAIGVADGIEAYFAEAAAGRVK